MLARLSVDETARQEESRRWSATRGWLHDKDEEEVPPAEVDMTVIVEDTAAAVRSEAAATPLAEDTEPDEEEADQREDSLLDQLSNRFTNAMKSIEAGTSSVASKSSLAAVKEKADEEEGAPVANRMELSA